MEATAATTTRRSLGSLYEPRSVAIVGASSNPMKWGHWLARDALEGDGKRNVYLVNVRGGEILGQPAHTSVAELPEPPELVVLTVPESGFEAAVEDSLNAGARALVAITSGFADTGEQGRARQQAVVASVREAGAVMLGPNCGGVADLTADLRLGLGGLTEGPIGLVCQSGNVALELARIAAGIGLGFTRVASIGNQADLELAELVADLAEHEPTRVIALYVEDFRAGRALTEAAAQAGKPVIVLAAGASDAGARAAASHTGAMVSSHEVVEAACRAAGAIRVSSLAEIAHVAQILLDCGRPTGPRVAIVTDGGGHGVISADLASSAGLDLPPLSEGLRGRILEMLPGRPVAGNPLDLAGAGDEDIRSYERVIEEIAGSGETDTILLTGYFGGYSVDAGEGAGAEETESEVALGMAEAARHHGVPLITQTMHWDSSPALALGRAGAPIFARVDDAITALGRIVEASGPRAGGLPSLPDPAPAFDREGYWAAREALESAGIPLAEARRVDSVDGALEAAEEIGYPVALKASDVLHKSDLGGVALGISGPGELRDAFERMAGIGSASHSVERMATLEGGFELLAGARWDPRFGPIVAVGLGGIYAEILDDLAVALAPVDRRGAEELLRSLRAAPLLLGARGRPAVDLATAADAVASLSRLAAAHPEVAEIEVNPLLVGAEGAVGLDARVVLAGAPGPGA